MSFFKSILIKLLRLPAEPAKDDSVWIENRTFPKERIRQIEDQWVKDGLIR